jgi:hypothetical protein
MAATPGKPSSGPLLFDVNEVEDAHADGVNEVEDAHADDQDNTVPRRRGEQERSEQERSGHAQIKAWLDKLTARSTPGEELGEPPDLHALIMDGTITLDDLRQYEHELKAAMDALHIARAKSEHDRDTQIMMIADKVVTAARRTGDAKLLKAYEQTIKYSREVARTRAKQAAQEAERERIARGR